jgi:nucleoside-diphosphate-sugar epimerase
MNFESLLKNEKVLVSGANGFIGYHLVRRLIHEGAEVNALIHENDHRIRYLSDDCSILRVDIRDIEKLSIYVKRLKPRFVFHLAAFVDVSRSSELIGRMMDINFGGTVNMLQAAVEAGCECFINSGTCEEYGDNQAPFKEEQCPKPVSPYSVSKASATMYCSMLAKTKACPVVTVRPFLTYGPFQTSDMLIPSVIMRALKKEKIEMTGGEQTREFNYIDDIVDGYIRAALTPAARGQIVNIGNGTEYAVKEVVTMILDLLGNPVKPLIGAIPYREGETWHFYCDNTRAKEVLGWRPVTELREGLKMTIKWFSENQEIWRR